jgi:hypothetical protein
MTAEILAYLDGKATYRRGDPQVCPPAYRAYQERWDKGWRVAQLMDKVRAMAERWGDTLPLDV